MTVPNSPLAGFHNLSLGGAGGGGSAHASPIAGLGAFPGQSQSHGRSDFDIDFDRLESGQETRCTVMIRSIPNRLSAEMLESFIMNVTGVGSIDFVYLRMDFKTRANLGYCFVNFTSSAALLRFARASLGRPWMIFNSSKILGMTFATVQGRNALSKSSISLRY